MSVRTPTSAPPIPPTQDQSAPPLFSVMIPTYNCFHYIAAALKSVLEQDLGPSLMQIEVIDDHSTDGDVEALVKEIGKGRISFYKQEKNVGSLRNFETALNRSKGQLVHLLHGDDFVNKGFYQTIQLLFEQFPQAGAAFTEYQYVDEKGTALWRREQIAPQAQVLDNWLHTIAQGSKTQFVAKVVKRSVYEHLGGYYGVHYGEDWEMWVRIAANYPVAYSPEVLANYRLHAENITGRSLISGQAVKDILKVIDTVQYFLPEEQRKATKQNSRKNYSEYYAQVAHKLYHDYKSPGAALRLATDALKMNLNHKTLKSAFKIYVKYLIRYKINTRS